MFRNLKTRLAVVLALASAQLLAQGHDNTTRVKPGDIFYIEAGTNAKRFIDYRSWNSGLGTPQGVVFYSYYGPRPSAPTETPSWHGWIVDKDLTSPSCAWCMCQQSAGGIDILTNYALEDAMLDTAGYQNTKKIIEVFNDPKTDPVYRTEYDSWGNYSAAPACYHKDNTSHSWYLPALGQLNVLIGQLGVVNAALSVCGTPIRVSGWCNWWSSTQRQTTIRPQIAVIGPNACINTDGQDQYGPHLVRAVKSF